MHRGYTETSKLSLNTAQWKEQETVLLVSVVVDIPQQDWNNWIHSQFNQGIFRNYFPIRDTDVVKRMVD